VATKLNNSSESSAVKQYLTVNEVTSLEKRLKSRDLLILKLLYETGCTVTELVNLKVLYIKKTTITVDGRQTTSSPGLQALLRSWIEDNNLKQSSFVLCSRQSDRMTQRRVEQIVTSIASIYLKHVLSPQGIRYSHIIHRFLKGESPASIEARLGIQSIDNHLAEFMKYRQRLLHDLI